jgi:hypothetical protein
VYVTGAIFPMRYGNFAIDRYCDESNESELHGRSIGLK